MEKLGNAVSSNLTFNSEIGTSISLNVEVGQTIFVSGKSYTSTYPFYMLFNDNTFISKFSPHEDYKYYSSEKVTIPLGVNRIIVNGEKMGMLIQEFMDLSQKIYQMLKMNCQIELMI